jgi:hypothetical protein
MINLSHVVEERTIWEVNSPSVTQISTFMEPVVSQPNCEQCLDQRESFYDYRHLFLKINFNIILPHTPKSLRSFHVFGFSDEHFLQISSLLWVQKGPPASFSLTLILLMWKIQWPPNSIPVCIQQDGTPPKAHWNRFQLFQDSGR